MLLEYERRRCEDCRFKDVTFNRHAPNTLPHAMYNRKPRFVANKGRKLNFCLCVFCPLWSTYTPRTYTHMNSFPVFYLFAFSSETSTSTSSSMPSSPRSLSLQSPGRTRSKSPDGNRFAAGRSLASLLRSDDRNPLSDPASAAHSHAAGEGLSGHTLHRSAVFRIYAFDGYARSVFDGGDGFTVSVRGPSLVFPALRDCGDGTYECEWQASVTGTYLLSILLNGAHIAGSPYAAKVIMPGHDPSQCRIASTEESVREYDDNAVHAVAGTSASFDLDFRDTLGRPVNIDSRELHAILRTSEVRHALDTLRSAPSPHPTAAIRLPLGAPRTRPRIVSPPSFLPHSCCPHPSALLRH